MLVVDASVAVEAGLAEAGFEPLGGDAGYVALARRLECPLLTIDARLKRGAERIVEIVGPTEL
ncbi:MAG: hypothetical protein ACRDL1_04125 [Solirubrobacterales bacterium]